MTTSAPALLDHLGALSMSAPDVHGPLAVFPLFGPPPRLEYVSFAQGRAAGVSIKELDRGASVNDLLVINPTGTAVLLYEGEEVLGAQQNRTFDVSVLVGAGSRLHVPVSCVEAGRWDGSRHGEAFEVAPQAAYPSLRRMKNTASRASVAAGMAPRADQGEVWNEVARKSARMAVASPTNAMRDIYDTRRERLDEFCRAIPIHDGQTGALVLVGGRSVVLDHVSRPDVFAALHGPLVQGYALDALEFPSAAGGEPSETVAEEFLERVLGVRVTEHDGIGIGRDLRFAEQRVAGAGLLAGDELVQFAAFPDEPTPGVAPQSRIRRPSRRRAV